MKPDVLVAEIGSTITKLSAFSGIETKRPSLAGRGIALTSVGEGDVMIGLSRARQDLLARSGIDAGELGRDVPLFALSSAAGGLRMTVHGLTMDMTLRAAREASLGAGAIVVGATAGALTPGDIDEIRRLRPNLILLSGGVDHGDREVVVTNARRLSAAGLKVPVIYAGNVAAKSEVEKVFADAGMGLFVTENVYPRIDELNVGPTRRIIQEVFARHIVTAPGMERVKEAAGGTVVPTPGAVLKAAEILYDEIGDLAAVDVGGATTDVHSVTEGSLKLAAMTVSPEPLAKRTVEGDLGVFINAAHVAKEAREESFDLAGLVPLPRDEREIERARSLTRWAVDLSIWRHAGSIRVSYGAYGKSEIVEGRDLTRVRHLIGTGGALAMLPGGAEILAGIRRDPHKKKLLPPPEAAVHIDRDYVMAAAGILGERYRDAACAVMRKSLGLG
jgi:hypothetical protein